MIPSLGVVLIGGPRWVLPLPLPIFLVWPFVVIAFGGVTLAQRLVSRQGASFSRLAVVRVGLLALFQLSGLRVNVRSTDGARIFVWLV